MVGECRWFNLNIYIMANWIIKNVSIRGIAACVPKRVLETKDIPFFSDEECEKFIKSTGIVQRRIADNNVCTSDLCFEAAEKLLTDLNWNKADIDALVFVSTTPDYRTPATSCILQDRLGLSTSCFTLDISLGCCGYLHGLTVIASLMSSGSIKKALLLVGDTLFRTASPYDKSRYPLSGDAGTATAFEYDENADDIRSLSRTDGSLYSISMVPDSGFRHPVSLESFVYEDFGDGIVRAPIHAKMQGLEVFPFAIQQGPKIVQELLDRYDLNKDDEIDYYLFHQANLYIMKVVNKKLKLKPEKVPFNIAEFGNTSNACIPLTMVTKLRDELSNQKLSLILSVIGVGMTYGTIHLYTNKIVCPELIEI